MTTPFSAGLQAVGYLHQIRHALYALLLESNPGAAVVIEGLDDIEVRDAQGPVRLDQLKHHIKDRAKLTDASTDLWKTLRIWATQMRGGSWDPSIIKLQFITTAEAAPETAAWHLKNQEEGNRDPARARDLLLQAIAASRTNDKAILAAFTAFQALLEREQLNLLRAVTIFDGAPTILDLPALIKQRIQWAAPPSGALLDQLFEALEGWWFACAVEHLMKSSQEPLDFMMLRTKLWSITRQLGEDNLLITHAEAIPDYVVDPESDERIFVRQLRCLEISTDRIKQAILDYYRASEQRASWVRQDLLVNDEVLAYERRIVDEWETYRLALLDERLDQDLDVEAHCKAIGKDILLWAQITADIRIRPYVTDRFVLRGSFHILADADQPRLYWHPKFLERLEELLKS